MTQDKLRVGFSQGDINGIGLEVILKTFLEPELVDICTPILFSSQKTVGYFRKILGVDEFHFHNTKDLTQLNLKKPNVYSCYEEEINFELGKSTELGGKYARLSLEKATDALKAGQIDVLVTAPINKHNMQSESFKFAGHTEYLADKFGADKNAIMLMCSDDLRIGLVTGHIPVANVAQSISVDAIVGKLNQLNKTLQEDFGIRKPKIAVLGLNPHASDNGAIGKDDLEIVTPAISKVKDNLLVFGPYPADGFFGSGNYAKFDAVLAMYHDQGLIPFKTLAFNNGVNYTAGLPVVRTSPDHGTAYEIAGHNKANPDSLKKAIYLAIDIYRNRAQYKEINANPLAFGSLKKER